MSYHLRFQPHATHEAIQELQTYALVPSAHKGVARNAMVQTTDLYVIKVHTITDAGSNWLNRDLSAGLKAARDVQQIVDGRPHGMGRCLQ